MRLHGVFRSALKYIIIALSSSNWYAKAWTKNNFFNLKMVEQVRPRKFLFECTAFTVVSCKIDVNCYSWTRCWLACNTVLLFERFFSTNGSLKDFRIEQNQRFFHVLIVSKFRNEFRKFWVLLLEGAYVARLVTLSSKSRTALLLLHHIHWYLILKWIVLLVKMKIDLIQYKLWMYLLI